MSLNNRNSWQRRASLLLMAASGFAGLGYQIVWTQQCALWLGHESAGVLAVVAAFFGGIAVGALLFGRVIEKSNQPVRWYAGSELLIAVWSLLLAFAMPAVSVWLQNVTGVQPTPTWQWSVAFLGTFILLLPATAAMGATLPAMERLTKPLRDESRSIAPLYASNTFGAVIGVLAIAFFLVPEFGLRRTAVVCIVINILCGAASLWIFARDVEQVPHSTTKNKLAKSGLVIRFALTGLLGIGYEVLVVRVLSQVTEDTVYTFAMLLAVYLIGTAIGAACYARWLATHRDSKLDDRLLGTLSVACMMGTGSLWLAERVRAFEFSVLGSSMTAAIASEAVLALIAFGPPTLVMGALFSHLSARANDCGINFGFALGVNTLGASAAPMVFGVLAFPLLGPKLALLVIAIGYLALIKWRTWVTPLFWLPASAAIALAVWAPLLAFVDVPSGGYIVSYQEGVMAAVSVVEDADGVARLRIDNRQQEGSNATLRIDARQALLPVLLHHQPKRALFLGLGTGVTATSAASYPGLHVDAVELLPEVINASAYFTKELHDQGSKAGLELMSADARRFVRVSRQSYDVIVSDNFHPARSGSGSLYTVEHFTAVKKLLNSHGIFCQWLPLHQLDLETMRSIVQSFMSVYPDGWAMLASNSLETPVIGLVGRPDAERFDIDALREHLATIDLPPRFSNIGIEDEFALLGSFIAGPTALQHFAGSAPLNADDHPIVAYRAPRITYAPESLPRDRLSTLLQELSIEPSELIITTYEEIQRDETGQRLAAYWNARNRFIASGEGVQQSSDVRAMLAQVREPLLSVLRISPDFRPAYDPLLRMANMLAKTDKDSARALLEDLVRVQPARTEAGVALQLIRGAL